MSDLWADAEDIANGGPLSGSDKLAERIYDAILEAHDDGIDSEIEAREQAADDAERAGYLDALLDVASAVDAGDDLADVLKRLKANNAG